MIPGTVSKASESTVASTTIIDAKSDIVYVTGTTAVATIRPGLGTQQSQICILIPTDGSVVLATTGNILVGITAVINRAVWLVWSKKLQKWVINSGV